MRHGAALRQSRVVFSSLAEEGRDVLQQVSPSQVYSPEIELFEEETPAEDVYVIDKGLIKLTGIAESGRELIVGLRSSGWIVGASSVISGLPYPVSAATLTHCRLRRISAEVFLDLLATDVRVCCYVQQMQSSEVNEQINRVVGLGSFSARRRLERCLSSLVAELGFVESREGLMLQLPLKYWEIAELVAVTPSYLSRLLDQMEGERIVKRKRRWLLILDQSRLSPENS
jgi:CRP/FNR family transcriptional regulator